GHLLAETLLAGPDLASHPDERPGELTQGVVARRNAAQRGRLEGVPLDRGRGAHDELDLLEVFPLEIAEALCREGRVHPGPEDRRLDRLRQIVEGAQLDAADDRIELV